MKYCTNCGAPLAEGARFCTNCGAKVPVPTAPQAPAAKMPASKTPAAKRSGVSAVKPIVKDLFAGSAPGTMVLSNWTAAAPVQKVVNAATAVNSAARTVRDKAEAEPGRKRRGGCLRFFLIVIFILVVLAILPVVLEYLGLGDISEKISIFFEDIMNKIIG